MELTNGRLFTSSPAWPQGQPHRRSNDEGRRRREALLARDEREAYQEIEVLLAEQAEAPLGGLVGVYLVNVLEVNLALDERFGR